MKKFFCKALPCLENPFEKEAKPSFMAMFSLRNGEDEGSDEPEEATDILVPYVKIPIRLMKQQSLATTMLMELAADAVKARFQIARTCVIRITSFGKYYVSSLSCSRYSRFVNVVLHTIKI